MSRPSSHKPMRAVFWPMAAIVLVACSCFRRVSAWAVINHRVTSSFRTTITRSTQVVNSQSRWSQIRVAVQTPRTMSQGSRCRHSPSSTSLYMGLWDNLRNQFLQSRDGDFVKLETLDAFGPGPLLILYNVPAGIASDEIQDMLQDEAPMVWRRCQQAGSSTDGMTVPIARLDDSNIADLQESVLSRPLESALQTLLESTPPGSGSGTTATISAPTTAASSPTIPVLLFSGFSNKEMLQVYNVLANEIYLESQLEAACAKVVPNALTKPLQQVLDEICGDHADAMRMQQEQEQDGDNE